MSDVFPKQKMPSQRKRQQARRQRKDYRRKRDEAGRFSSTTRSISSRRYMRALARKTQQKRSPRKTSKNIYNERGGLVSQKAKRSGSKRGAPKRNKAKIRG